MSSAHRRLLPGNCPHRKGLSLTIAPRRGHMEIKTIAGLVRFADDQMQKITLFDSTKYICDLYCLKPGQDQRIHNHPESDKIYFVIRGKGWFHVAGEDRGLGAGEAVVARAG